MCLARTGIFPCVTLKFTLAFLLPHESKIRGGSCLHSFFLPGLYPSFQVIEIRKSKLSLQLFYSLS